MTNRDMRASDADREGVVTILREAFGEGRLTLDEFEERTTAAYASRTYGDLLDLTVDLPVQPVLSVPHGPPGHPAHYQAQQYQGPPLPYQLPQPARPRRGPDFRLLPALFIWAVIAAAAGSPWVAGVLTVFFVGLLASRLSTRWR